MRTKRKSKNRKLYENCKGRRQKARGKQPKMWAGKCEKEKEKTKLVSHTEALEQMNCEKGEQTKSKTLEIPLHCCHDDVGFLRRRGSKSTGSKAK